MEMSFPPYLFTHSVSTTIDNQATYSVNSVLAVIAGRCHTRPLLGALNERLSDRRGDCGRTPDHPSPPDDLRFHATEKYQESDDPDVFQTFCPSGFDAQLGQVRNKPKRL